MHRKLIAAIIVAAIAVPGVRNPVNTVGFLANGTQIAGPASIRFASGWEAGGFVMVRILLQQGSPRQARARTGLPDSACTGRHVRS